MLLRYFHGGNRGSNPLGTPILATCAKSTTYDFNIVARCIGEMYISCIGSSVRLDPPRVLPDHPLTKPPSIGITAPVT
jgi:hypothetical protein